MRTSTELLAYAAIMLGVFGHATSEFVAVQTGLSGPEQSVWRFMLGGAGLLTVASGIPVYYFFSELRGRS